MTLRSFIVPGVLVALAIAACDDAPPPPPPKPVPEQKPKPLPDPLANMESADAGTAEAPAAYVYAYNPVAKRDPFRSPIIDRPKEGEGGNGPACEGPLANWDLEQLKLVATVTSDANPMGMVEDPGGKGYVVRRNSMMGRLCGKVTEVLRECITVTEYFQQPDGKRVPNAKKLCLRADVGGEAVEDLSTGKKYQ